LWPSPEAAKKGIKSIWDHADIIKVWHQWSIESCLGTHTLVDILVCICQILFYFQALYNILFEIDGIYIIIRFMLYNYYYFSLGNFNLLPHFFQFSWQGKKIHALHKFNFLLSLWKYFIWCLTNYHVSW
jgi:hypothetical protein